MKKYIAFLTVIVAIVATGCTNLGEENQLSLSAAPEVVISDVVAQQRGDSITFKVAPAAAAGYYAWLLVKSDVVDATLTADKILKQTATGVAKGLVKYATKNSVTIGVGKLTPFTVYQIYAVVSSPDGVVSAISNTSIRTLDNGGKPTPTTAAISGDVVTLPFNEPLKLGSGKVFVSYFAKNAVSGAKPLVLTAGLESYSPQNVLVNSSNVSVSGKNLVVKLTSPLAGAYASITYEEGAVTDLEGNLCSPYSAKADTLIAGVPSRGITVRIPTKTWALQGEFEDINPDTVAAFSTWSSLKISLFPVKEEIKVSKKIATVTPKVLYQESGKTTTINVKSWGLSSGVPAFYLPEAPSRGATVDLTLPSGAFEDVYGNTSEAVSVVGNYLYSYGYTLADITGTWQINGINATTLATIAPETVIIESNASGSHPYAVVIKNMAKNITTVSSVVEAEFDPVLGKLTVPDWQTLATDWVHPTAGTADVFFSSTSSPAIIFAVQQSGTISSSNEFWGYYLAKGSNYLGWLRRYHTSTTWTRTSTSTSAPALVKNVKENVSIVKAAKKITK